MLEYSLRRRYGTEKASLACVDCGSRNYSISVSSTPKPTRLEVNKFCKHCKKYTLHKETR
ncbi:50S ribosomal protein L33 [Streptococcus iniae]